jgi:hypothetical protein
MAEHHPISKNEAKDGDRCISKFRLFSDAHTVIKDCEYFKSKKFIYLSNEISEIDMFGCLQVRCYHRAAPPHFTPSR